MKAEKRDYYEILGLQRGCEVGEIKKAYRRLAMETHPDRNPGDTAAEERFKEASEAYQVLCDPERRAQYDRFGHAASQQGGGFDFSGASPRWRMTARQREYKHERYESQNKFHSRV